MNTNDNILNMNSKINAICDQRDFLYYLLKRRFPNARKEDIEDSVQNAIIKAVKFIDKWQGNCSLKNWLAVITINMYTDTFRKTYVKNEYLFNSTEELFIFDKIPVDDFSKNLCESDYQSKLVKELLTGFEDNVHVQAFTLNVIYDIGYKEIAIQQNIPVGTVKSRVFRAKKLLQEKYRQISHKHEDLTV
jgi:RNA polymerase sigma-70 factor (ECF subfamily)